MKNTNEHQSTNPKELSTLTNTEKTKQRTNVYVIGDIAGRFNELLLLEEKFNKPYHVIGVGDLVDRGPKSRQVVQHFIDNGWECTKGNHEDMMVDATLNTHQYEFGTWFANGGNKTLNSYDGEVTQDHIEWLKKLPEEILVVVDNKPFCIRHTFPVEDPNQHLWAGGASEELWNREEPTKVNDGGYMVTGHNSHWGLRTFETEKGKPIGICIDCSGSRKLTAYHLNTGDIIQVSYAV